jgi:hypothetical protein
MNPPGWFVDWRVVVVLCLLATTSILLAAKSSIDDRRAIQRIRQANAIIDSLSKGRWVQLDSEDVIIRRRGTR